MTFLSNYGRLLHAIISNLSVSRVVIVAIQLAMDSAAENSEHAEFGTNVDLLIGT